MKTYRLIYHVGLFRAREELNQQYGRIFVKEFSKKSKEYLMKVIAKTPDIGHTVFTFNYAFAPAYIAWYKAAQDLGCNKDQLRELLWLVTEKIITLIPKFCRAAYGKKYLTDFRKKAHFHDNLITEGKVHPYDYLIKFHPGDQNTFGIDITRCGMMTLAKDFDAMGIFPTVCRIDYMMANILHMGFERLKTLGDKDCCCACKYTIGGQCEWAPEKGFAHRKQAHSLS